MPGWPQVELFWWRECPSWERALAILHEEMEGAGLDPESAQVTEIATEEAAERAGFPGSPTIRVDGRDIQPPDPEGPRGLTCRVYRRRDGSVSPLPDREDVREALENAMAAMTQDARGR
jgi:hypothetical protein